MKITIEIAPRKLPGRFTHNPDPNAPEDPDEVLDSFHGVIYYFPNKTAAA